MISLDDRLADHVKKRAAGEGLSVSAFIARILDDALKRPAQRPQRPFRLITVNGPGLQPGIDLDHTNTLLAEDDLRPL